MSYEHTSDYLGHSWYTTQWCLNFYCDSSLYKGFDEQETCTTPECKRGCFSSPNYPENYRQRWTKQYIVNVPGAMYYTVKCDEIFHIEEIRDALYVGPENPPPSNTLPIDPEEPILLFYGETPPDRFLVDSGEMWMYFITDRLEEHEGWRCCWIAGKFHSKLFLLKLTKWTNIETFWWVKEIWQGWW